MITREKDVKDDAKSDPKKLSGGLLNMKFMQQAIAKEDREQAKEEEQRKKDASEWSLRDSIEDSKFKKKTAKILSFGDVSDLLSEVHESQDTSGRHTWGDLKYKQRNEKRKVEADEEDGKNTKKIKNISRGGLSSAPKSVSKKKK